MGGARHETTTEAPLGPWRGWRAHLALAGAMSLVLVRPTWSTDTAVGLALCWTAFVVGVRQERRRTKVVRVALDGKAIEVDTALTHVRIPLDDVAQVITHGEQGPTIVRTRATEVAPLTRDGAFRVRRRHPSTPDLDHRLPVPPAWLRDVAGIPDERFVVSPPRPGFVRREVRRIGWEVRHGGPLLDLPVAPGERRTGATIDAG